MMISGERSDEKSSLYVYSLGNYTCIVAIQVFLTLPSKIEIVRREASLTLQKMCMKLRNTFSLTFLADDANVNHIMINVFILFVAMIIIGVCVLVIRYKKSKFRRFDKTASLTISPSKFDKKSAKYKSSYSVKHNRLKYQRQADVIFRFMISVLPFVILLN
uniref:Uncharacterized protein n=1 Tax=Romanomermis culicivorax TaxID=13658 RepID=A0A915L324_ROMCU